MNALRRQKQHGFFLYNKNTAGLISAQLVAPGLRRLYGENGKPLEKVARPTVSTAPAGNGQSFACGGDGRRVPAGRRTPMDGGIPAVEY